MVDFVRRCRESGVCELTRHYAFSEIDFTGFDYVADGDVHTKGYFSDWESFCCEEGQNCNNGFEGCLPDCTACCSHQDCEYPIVSCYKEVLVCVDDICADFEVWVPYQHISGNSMDHLDMSTVSFSSSAYSNNYLKSQRNVSSTETGDWCQKEDGKHDSDFVCTLKMRELFSSNSDCPPEC